jgi:hypothetical protein
MDRTKLNQDLNENQMIFYGTKEIARSLGCSIPLAREIMHRPDFPLVKVGKNLKVYKSAFEKWASERRL